MLDHQPVRALAAESIAAHPHEHPASAQPFAVERELEFAFRELRLGGFIAFWRPVPAIPQLHRPAAVLAFRNRAFEVAVVERVVLHLDRQALVCRIERRTARYRPGLEDAIMLQAEVVVQPRGGMLLDHETRTFRRRDLDLA